MEIGSKEDACGTSKIFKETNLVTSIKHHDIIISQVILRD